ncbi:MAG: restriction endonuclease subunit S [Bacteroides sp.]|nr:restriction endonuclease subunit S [Bacteroides sp.]
MNGKQLKNSILQWAIQGKLVPQDPNDEPASVLLERIRAEKARLVKEGKIKKDKNESIIFRGDDNSHYEKIVATGEVKCIDEEIPFDIPDTWEWCRVSSLFQINPKVIADDNANAAFIPMEAISAGYGSEFRYYEKKWSEIKTGYTSFADNDIAFAKITPCFQNRKSAIFKELPNGIGAGTTELKILRTFGETMNRWFVLYFLESSYFIDEATFKGTANQQRIVVGYLENKLFPVPPLAEQERIVERIGTIMPIIDKYSNSQERLNKINAKLKESLKKSILQDAIQGKLVQQLPEEGAAQELLEQIRNEKQILIKEGRLKRSALADSVIFKGDDNKYYERMNGNLLDISDEVPFDLPDSWAWARLSTVCNMYTGNSISERDKSMYFTGVSGMQYIGTKDVRFDNSIDYKNGIAIPDKFLPNFKIAPSGSVLMCIEGGSAGRKFGQTDRDVCFGNKLCCFSSFGCYQRYLYYYIQSPSFFESFQKNKTGIIGGVSVNSLKNLLIAIPPLKEQVRIAQLVADTLAHL